MEWIGCSPGIFLAIASQLTVTSPFSSLSLLYPYTSVFTVSGPIPFTKLSPVCPTLSPSSQDGLWIVSFPALERCILPSPQAGLNFECSVCRAPFVFQTFDGGFFFPQHAFCLPCLSFVQHLSHEHCDMTKLVTVIPDVPKLTEQMVPVVLD